MCHSVARSSIRAARRTSREQDDLLAATVELEAPAKITPGADEAGPAPETP